ncbi:hypothetical protein Tco_0592968 [Tanacetum coccineum]
MHRSTHRAHRSPTIYTASPQGKKRKQIVRESSSPQKSLKITIRQKHVVKGEKDDDDSEDRLEPGSHKDNLEHVDNDDDDKEKVDEKKDVEMGSLETRTEEMKTPIPTILRSPRTILSSDKNITQELTDTVSLPTATTSKNPHFRRSISSKYSHLLGALHRMCKRQGYMIQNMERKCVTIKYFWKTHKKVDRVLHEIVPQITERATDDLIENNLKSSIAETIIEDRDAFRLEVHDLVSQEFHTQAPKIIEELFKNYMKRSLQDQANDLALWEVLEHKFKKSFTSNTSYRDDDIHSQRHDNHQEDDAPLKGEKRVKRRKASKSSKYARGSSSKHSAKDSITYSKTPELITELYSVDKHVPTIFDSARIEATLNDMLSNLFKNAKEITVVVRIITNEPYGLDFMEQIIMMRQNDKPNSFFEADFRYLNKKDIEDLYYLCQNKKVNHQETKLMNSLIMFIRSRVIWERVHDFQLGIKSYQIKVNLTTPTLTFCGIEKYEPYSIVGKPTTGLYYLNRKYEKWAMYLVEIVELCDATLEKILKELKLKIFQSESWMKSPLLGELDRDIMRGFEREITKRLRHYEQMRRWESFVNGIPILLTMKYL